jgi:hypothetical protein
VGTRDLGECVDLHGHISVHVKIGGAPGAATRETGASADPVTVAGFLRELAGDVERAGERCRFPPRHS